MTSAFGTYLVELDIVVTYKRAPIVWRLNALTTGVFCWNPMNRNVL